MYAQILKSLSERGQYVVDLLTTVVTDEASALYREINLRAHLE
jgi:hypothetical protein